MLWGATAWEPQKAGPDWQNGHGLSYSLRVLKSGTNTFVSTQGLCSYTKNFCLLWGCQQNFQERHQALLRHPGNFLSLHFDLVGKVLFKGHFLFSINKFTFAINFLSVLLLPSSLCAGPQHSCSKWFRLEILHKLAKNKTQTRISKAVLGTLSRIC